NNNKVDNVQVQSYVGSSSSFQAILNYLGTLIPDKSKVFPAFALKPNGNPISNSEVINFITTTRTRGYNGNSIWYFTDLATYFSDLKSTVYAQKTHPPYTIAEWREFYKILPFSDTTNAIRTGNWIKSTIFGFDGASYYTNNQLPSKVEYYLDVPAEGYYEVYAFNVVASNRNDSAIYKVFDKNGIEHQVLVNQTISDYRRWIKLGDYLLSKGRNKVISISNENLASSKNLSADAIMISLNRRLSPDVVLSNKEESSLQIKKKDNSEFGLKSYPNPFNNSTKIHFTISDLEPIQIRIYNTIGQQVFTEIFNPTNLGEQSFSLEKFSVSGGVYFFEVVQKQNRETLKIVMIK
ncbi:MAG: T9SS type A sorting domain-containing protein, partial [Ignavibacteriaceae bacterium]|nr:T9SS type A sorting domain-containing protein [Ignavibacteriaceae bacterium]